MLSVPSTELSQSKRTSVLAALLALALTLAVFQSILHAAFVNWDDPVHIYQNPYLNPVTWAHVGHFWRAPYEGLYIPLSYTVYAALALLAHRPTLAPDPSGGMTPYDPRVFHAACLVLHLANVLIVFVLLRRLFGKDWAACGGALLFGLHPLQVESVAWISELRGLLGTVFSLLALWQYIEYAQSLSTDSRARRLRYGLALAAFGLALLSKPSAVAVPLIAAVLDWGLLQRPGRQVARALLGWAVVTLPIVLLTRGAQPVPAALQIPLWQRPLIAGDALAFYLGKLIFPIRLGAVYDRTPAHVLQNPWTYGMWLIPVALFILLWLGRRRFRPLLVAGGVLVAGVLPVLGLVPFIYQTFSTVADRYMYLAMLGPAIGLAWLLTRVRTPTVPALTVAALGTLAVLSVSQVSCWQNSISLFEHALAIAPKAPAMHTDYGQTLMAEGRTADAMQQYASAISADTAGSGNPITPLAHYDLGMALQKIGHPAEAAAQYQTALAAEPGSPGAHYNLAIALQQAGKPEQAVAQYHEALSGDPGGAVTHYDLAIALQQSGRSADAVAQYLEALRCKPNYAEAHCNLGQLLSSLGQTDAAESHLRQALALDPDLAQAHYSLGLLFADQGHTADAIQEWGRTTALWPSFPDAHYNLSIAYRKMGNSTQAAAELRRFQQLKAASPVSAPM